MVHSDWGDWLPKAIENADPEGVAAWYLGCNGLVLTDGDTTLFVDPYLGTGDPPRTVRMVPIPFAPEDVESADAVFATHEHSDHVDGPSQGPILASTGATYYAPDDSLAIARENDWADEWDLTDDQFVEVSEGDTHEFGAFTVTVTHANDPDATHPVGYVFEHPAGTFFHGGDTKPGDDLEPIGEAYDLDYAVCAFGAVGMILDKETREPKRTRWYSDENQAIEVANQLQVDTLVPTHWDMWKGLTADPTALHPHARSYDYPNHLEVVEIGDRIDY